jgi:carboxymethylenebutenolidase
MNERISIETPDGSFEAYMARPEADNAPSIVVIQEIFGINADIRAHCDALAAKGYIAVAPDLFWRLQPGVELTDGSKEEWAQAMEYLKAFDIEAGVRDIAATMGRARSISGASGKIGVMGFCLGGLMTFLSAARNHPDAAVSFYGGRTSDYLSEMSKVTCPLMIHLAEEDQYIPKPAQEKIRVAATPKDNVELFVYPGQDHAFARVNGSHFNAEAAALANERTDAFFSKHLRQPTTIA